MLESVKGRTALVTGAGSGINLEFARLLLNGGANVLFADLSLRPEAQELVQKYDSSNMMTQEPRAIFQATDVSDWTQLSRMFEVAEKQFGEIDIVCPGAGVYEPPFSNFWYPPGSSESRDTVDGGRYATLDINLTHPFRVTQLAIAHFLKHSQVPTKPRFILHISSVAGQNPGFATPLYVAAKHAINGFVRSLAPLEAAHNIRVTAVAPGIILTPLWTDHPEKIKIVSNTDDWVLPGEVAKAMLALVERNSVAGEEGEIPVKGGTIVEVGKTLREVKAFNDPGCQGRPGTKGNSYSTVVEDALQNLQRPGWGLN